MFKRFERWLGSGDLSSISISEVLRSNTIKRAAENRESLFVIIIAVAHCENLPEQIHVAAAWNFQWAAYEGTRDLHNELLGKLISDLPMELTGDLPRELATELPMELHTLLGQLLESYEGAAAELLGSY